MNLPQYRRQVTNTLLFLPMIEPALLGAAGVRRAQDRVAQLAAKLRAGMDAERLGPPQPEHSRGKLLLFASGSRVQTGPGLPSGPASLVSIALGELNVGSHGVLVNELPSADLNVSPRVGESSSMDFRRPQERKRRMLTASDLRRMPDGAFVRTAGRVIARQSPGRACGFVSLSIEDETGITNIIVDPELYQKVQLLAAGGRFLQVGGRVEKNEGVVHIRASRIRVFDTAHAPSRSLDSR